MTEDVLQPDPGAPERQTVSELDDWLASVAAPPFAVAAEPPPSEDAPAPAVVPTLLEALAAVPQPGSPEAADVEHRDARELRRYVLFTVAGDTYGVPDTLVTEVGRVPKVTLVPHTPAWVRGVTSLRGDVLSVIDLRTFLALEPTAAHNGRLLVARLADEEFSIGILVDSVDQIAGVPLEEVRPPVSPLAGALAPFLTGVCQAGDRVVAVLDLDRLLRSPEIRQFEDGDAAAAGGGGDGV